MIRQNYLRLFIFVLFIHFIKMASNEQDNNVRACSQSEHNSQPQV